MKFIISILFFVLIVNLGIILSQQDTLVVEDETAKSDNSEQSKQEREELDKEMADLMEKDVMTREEFIKFFRDMLMSGVDIDDRAKSLYGDLIERVSKKVPDSFPRDHLSKYLDWTEFMNIMKDAVKEKATKEEI